MTEPVLVIWVNPEGVVKLDGYKIVTDEDRSRAFDFCGRILAGVKELDKSIRAVKA